MNVKKIKCYIKAVPFYLKSGLFIPHVYKDIEIKRTDIFCTNKGFRVANTLEHSLDEKLIKDVLVTKSKCIYCGNIEMSWCWNKENNLTEGE